ncbi:hypothetical protein GRW89_26875 [Pseudomonas moraviensis]|uniref:hypothetical protein n=1 Tax=Pseudomonas moraviensis TaxID=321662 RepID=UPI00135D96B8|nr:hypothetical protein [Pseudomonas moraviensis]MXI50137.1 hypothetical protein [Pseudomonas moraviensis]
MKKVSLNRRVKDAASEMPITDYAEALIDAFVESDVLKDVPVVSSIFGVSRAYKRFKNSRFKQKVEEFYRSAGTYTEEEMKRFSFMLEKDGKKEEFLFSLIELLEKVDSEQKAKIIGGVFRRLVKREIDVDQFYDQVRVINSMMLMDIFKFMHGYHNDFHMEDGLGDILLVLRLTKRDIALAMRTVNMMKRDSEQYVKISFALTGAGKNFLTTLHQVYEDKIDSSILFKG